MSKLSDNSFDPCEDASMHAHQLSDRDRGMRAQDASAGQALANSLDLGGAHCFTHTASEQAKDTWSADDRNARFAGKAHKDVSGKERALQVDNSIRPL
jgi:hypothetical protein